VTAAEPYLVATRTAIGGEVHAQVAEDYGSNEDAKALAALVSAGRRAWAMTSHPEPLGVPCPRPGCGAEAGDRCSTTGGTVLPWGHRERHRAAIEADGRTCADEGES